MNQCASINNRYDFQHRYVFSYMIQIEAITKPLEDILKIFKGNLLLAFKLQR